MKRLGKIISMGIQKGGAGKTTTCAMLSHIYAGMGYKVLAVDFDSQGNLTQFLSRKDPYTFQYKTALQACMERNPKPYIVEVEENIHLLPAEDFLSKFANYVLVELPAEISLKGQESHQFAPALVLKETLEVVRHDYDFIFIDLPPNLGEQTINGMVAGDYAVVVLQAEPFCQSALERYLETLESAIINVNPNGRLLGIVTTLMDKQASLPKFVLEQTREAYQELVFNTVISRRAKIMEYSHSINGYSYKTKLDREAQSMHFKLAYEMLEKMGIEHNTAEESRG